MLMMHFDGLTPAQAIVVGPAPFFRITGDRITRGPAGDEIAVYEEGMWHVGGDSFIVILTDAPTMIRFENADGEAGEYGPYAALKIVDGAIRTGEGYSDLLARLDEKSQTWHVYPEGKGFPAAILLAV
jgi:hypothetical protein